MEIKEYKLSELGSIQLEYTGQIENFAKEVFQ